MLSFRSKCTEFFHCSAVSRCIAESRIKCVMHLEGNIIRLVHGIGTISIVFAVGTLEIALSLFYDSVLITRIEWKICGWCTDAWCVMMERSYICNSRNTHHTFQLWQLSRHYLARSTQPSQPSMFTQRGAGGVQMDLLTFAHAFAEFA